MTRAQIITVARSYIGTPYHHGARVKGLAGGIDCAGLLICVARELGLGVPDSHYTPEADSFEKMCSAIAPHCLLVGDGSLLPADIAAFRGRMMMQHCGIVTERKTLIHACNSPGFMKVIEQPFDKSWELRLQRTYRLSGVTD